MSEVNLRHAFTGVITARWPRVWWLGCLFVLIGVIGSVACVARPASVAKPLAEPLAAPSATALAPRATRRATLTILPAASTPEPSPMASPAGPPTATPRPPSLQQPYSTTLQLASSSATVDVHGLLYLPADYGRDPQRRWPLIVFLHGSGERGTDVQQLTSSGLPEVLAERSDLPFIVLSPQLPPGEGWNDKGPLLDALLDQVVAQYAVDARRVYLTGFSLGGFGAWALGLRHPDRFAALVPVAGGWESGSDRVPSNICDLAAKPIWVFHGAQDETVKPRQSEVLVDALRACGSEVRYTLLPRATHAASGLLPYLNSELYDWLLAQALPASPPAPLAPHVPEMVTTPLPGAGALKLIGQHAYTIALTLTGAKGLTRTATISYLLYLPAGYGQDPQQQWPLVLFLHGSDVWGNDPAALVASGLPKLLTSTLDFPAIVLSPQAPQDVVWWGEELDKVSALLDQVQATYAVDATRLYLTGLSTGGFGAWALAMRQPQRFAALAPVAGGWDSERDSVPRNLCDLKHVPIWVFHGKQDDIVRPKKAQLLVDALQKCGSTIRFTLYPEADHRESFKRAYADPELYRWLFEQHLP